VGGIRPWPTQVKQVCVVVHDLDATIRRYHETVGIGPWAVWTPQLTDMRIRGVEMPYSMKLALAWTQDFMWEVVQPLEGPSIYKEFLAKRGEGMHHVLIETAGHQYEDLLEEARTKGCPPLMEGKWGETEFAYLDSQGPLRLYLEVFRRGPNFTTRPEPDYYYPAAPGAMPT
jgi:methylmalonyl-CoA/ethylmalonyl-CoA epimerase